MSSSDIKSQRSYLHGILRTKIEVKKFIYVTKRIIFYIRLPDFHILFDYASLDNLIGFSSFSSAKRKNTYSS